MLAPMDRLAAVTLALACWSAAAADADTVSAAEREEIEQYLSSRWEAVRRRDTLALQESMERDWIGFSYLSDHLMHDREEWLAGLELELGRAEFLEVRLGEQELRSLGYGLVVVSYTIEARRRTPDTEFDLPLQGLSVLRRDDRGGWIEVAGQLAYSPAALPVLWEMNLEELFQRDPDQFKGLARPD
jgi:hypothetical protein